MGGVGPKNKMWGRGGGVQAKKYGWGGHEKNKMCGGASAEKIKCMGGVREKIKMCGGSSGIFSSPSPPEDFKWNSPNCLFVYLCAVSVFVMLNI